MKGKQEVTKTTLNHCRNCSCRKDESLAITQGRGKQLFKGKKISKSHIAIPEYKNVGYVLSQNAREKIRYRINIYDLLILIEKLLNMHPEMS